MLAKVFHWNNSYNVEDQEYRRGPTVYKDAELEALLPED